LGLRSNVQLTNFNYSAAAQLASHAAAFAFVKKA
jgi:hypothetical protein